MRQGVFIIVLLHISCILFAQSTYLSTSTGSSGGFNRNNLGGSLSMNELAGQVNVITTAVPFLMIAPESRGGALGDIGVATSPDVNSMHWNPAKYAFIKSNTAVALSYTPWLRKLVSDINLSYLVGCTRIDKNQVVAASLRYFSLGNITFTNSTGGFLRDFNPNEFAIDLGYALKLSQKFSGGIALRYIYSNLTGGFSSNNDESTHAANAVAADISAFYTNEKLKIFQKKSTLNWGIAVSNIGNKISYTDDAVKNFLPTNLKLGIALSMDLDAYNTIMISSDINKLLVPTPPVMVKDSLGGYTIIGKISEVSVAKGMFQSFSDAPGGFKEEMNEVIYSFGAEYWYAKQFAIRAGYFHENELKGNRKYFTVGLGLHLNVFGLNFSYLMPTNQHNPLENTVRFSLIFDFEKVKKEEEKTE
jgi:hypothetical protein